MGLRINLFMVQTPTEFGVIWIGTSVFERGKYAYKGD
jgi:hypothetical protein